MNFIASLEPQVVMYILSSISEGLTALGKYSLKKKGGAGGRGGGSGRGYRLCVCFRYDGMHRLLLQSGPHRHLLIQAAVALHEKAARSHGDGRPLPAHHAAASGDDPAGQRSAPDTPPPPNSCLLFQSDPVAVLQMLSTVLNIIIFEDCRNQWSMSRPLLGLILLNEKVKGGAARLGERASPHTCVCDPVVLPQYFADLRNSIVNSQPPEKQQAMHLCFENLMEGIERNLLTKNRDRWVW